ncbi:MAG TPA: DNA-directed RNA polymerase subunit L [Thermoplasmata archaeon]|nr:DNA-directed RNA polymerase subunit L [Thermoplasmata archaeon]
MELKLIEKEKTAIRVEIVHPDDTLIYPLVSALLKDEDVADAQYITGHPQLDKPVLFVKTKKGEAQAALRRAAEGLSAKYRETKATIEKALAK